MFGFELTAPRAISQSFEKGAFWKLLAEIRTCQKFLEKRNKLPLKLRSELAGLPLLLL